jgi:hypothetical protein
VDVDLNRLPIPDWDLECPECRYPLRGLPSHRCPECGLELDMHQVVRPWHRVRPPHFTGTERPLPDFGLACDACDVSLAGAAGEECPACGTPFDLEALRPQRDWFVLDRDLTGELLMPAVQTLLAHEHVPHFEVHDDALRRIYGTAEVTVRRLRVASEFYFEVLHLLQEARLEYESARAAADEPGWACPGCGEENPLHFEVCWNCETPRGG